MPTKKSKIFRTKIVFIYKYIIVAILLQITSTTFSQPQLFVDFTFKVDEGTLHKTKVIISCDGKNWKQIAQRKMKKGVHLDFQHDYIFTFTKPGYISKKVLISTKIPQNLIGNGFDTYRFALTLFKLYDGVNLVVFNQPVARVAYKPDIDDFDYDTDYTKSILPQLDEAERQIQEKKSKLDKEQKEILSR